MSKGLPRSLSRGNAQVQAVRKLSVAVDEVLTFTGATGVAVFATTVLQGLPEGNILLLGGVANITLTGPGSADLADDFQGDYSVGTTPANDATLVGSDIDLIGVTTIVPAAAELAANNRGTNSTSAILNNTAGQQEVNLNILLDADEITNLVSVDIAVTGTVDILYSMLGDD